MYAYVRMSSSYQRVYPVAFTSTMLLPMASFLLSTEISSLT